MDLQGQLRVMGLVGKCVFGRCDLYLALDESLEQDAMPERLRGFRVLEGKRHPRFERIRRVIEKMADFLAWFQDDCRFQWRLPGDDGVSVIVHVNQERIEIDILNPVGPVGQRHDLDIGFWGCAERNDSEIHLAGTGFENPVHIGSDDEAGDGRVMSLQFEEDFVAGLAG